MSADEKKDPALGHPYAAAARRGAARARLLDSAEFDEILEDVIEQELSPDEVLERWRYGLTNWEPRDVNGD
jgi:hypothetical protein